MEQGNLWDDIYRAVAPWGIYFQWLFALAQVTIVLLFAWGYRRRKPPAESQPIQPLADDDNPFRSPQS
jgi:hypothetical protein